MSRSLIALAALACIALVLAAAGLLRSPAAEGGALETGQRDRVEELAPPTPPPTLPAVAAREEPLRRAVESAPPPPAARAAKQTPPASAPAREATAVLVVRVFKQGTAEPVAGAEVFASPEMREREDPGPVIHTFGADGNNETDASGRVELTVEAGVAHTLFTTMAWSAGQGAEPIGYADTEVGALLPGQRLDVVVYLPFGEDLAYWGRVRSELDGSPIAGARVLELEGRGWSGEAEAATDFFDGELRAETDASGLFELRTRSWDPAQLALVAPGFGPRVFLAHPGHAAPADACALRLLPSATLRARLVDRAGSGPLELVVSAGPYELGDPREDASPFDDSVVTDDHPAWSARCDANGWCTLSGLPARVPLDALVRAGDAERRIPGAITLAPGELREVEWTLGGGARLSGTARDQHGAPAADVELWLVTDATVGLPGVARCRLQEYWEDEVVARADTDEAGAFAFEDVAPGRWWIGPRADSREPGELSPDALAIDVPPGSAELRVDLRLQRGLTLRGRIVAPDGERGVEGWVQAYAQEFPAWIHGQSERDGRFTLGPLSPGTWVLQATCMRAGLAESEPVPANAGDEGVLLRLRRGGRIAGRVVVRETGEPREATLGYSSQSGEEGSLTTTATEADGSFELAGLLPGTWQLSAVTRDGLVACARDIEVGDDDAASVLLEVAPGARLELRYEGEHDSCHYSLWQGDVPVAFDGLLRGTTAEEAVPAGPVRLEYAVPGRPEQRLELQLEVGEVREVLLEPGD